jgi:hypothetical protein
MILRIPFTARLREINEGAIPSADHDDTGDMMMKKLLVLTFLSASLLSSAGLVQAAPSKTYQVTGPVLELRDDVIIVQKGKEKWEIARAADTKVKGDLKVGAKVTIDYRMTAATVEVKEDAKAKDDAKAKK